MKGKVFLLTMISLLSNLGRADDGVAPDSSPTETGKVSGAVPMVAGTASLAANGETSFDLTPMADAKTPLANPDKGWYLHYYDNGTHNYGKRKSAEWTLEFMPYLDHVYLRMPWCTVEPEEGQFKWELIDKVVDDFAQFGVGVSFRSSCKEGGSYCPYATPKWVEQAGAKGTKMGDGAWEPDYGDEIYLQKLENFHRAFAARYAGNPGVRYIDVGSYGDWGEGHTAASSRKRWPWSAIQRHFDIYAQCYPGNLIAVSDDFVGSGHVSELGPKGAAMREYVKSHGWTWRDDSICVDWFMKHCGATDSVRSPFLFDEIWESKPVVMELEHYTGVINTTWHPDNWRSGSVFKAACRRTHATYAGFHGFIDVFMKGDNVAYAAEMANLLGYWYFLDKMNVARRGSQLTCAFSWRNEGFAKAYGIYDLDLILTDANGRDHVFNLKDFDNTQIMPKDSADETAVAPTHVTSHIVDLGGLPGGEYTLSIRMHKGDIPVLLALKQDSKGADGRYAVANVAL